jgi:predicted amidohydrolase
MERRSFLKNSAVAATALATGLGQLKAGPAPDSSVTAEKTERIGRPVRVVSIGFHPGHSLDEIAAWVDQAGAGGTDLVVLPETCRGQDGKNQESLSGPTITALSRLARKHRTYIVCPIDRRTATTRHNSAVLLDRRGEVACVYDKIYPVWNSECLQHPPIHPGEAVCVQQTDFGRLGFAICFDVNWPRIWERMSNHGAELVVWPSAYSAGRSLQSHAISYNYYIVSATWTPDCLVYDLDGEQLVHETNNRGEGLNITRVTLDLDRCIFHQDLNLPDKLARLLKDHGDEVIEEKWLPLEGWFILKAKRPGVSARELAQLYGLEELRHYINRSRCEIDKCRGWEFA